MHGITQTDNSKRNTHHKCEKQNRATNETKNHHYNITTYQTVTGTTLKHTNKTAHKHSTITKRTISKISQMSHGQSSLAVNTIRTIAAKQPTNPAKQRKNCITQNIITPISFQKRRQYQ